MFENFKKIKIQGGCFEQETELELFKECPISVLYGRNGSGKTTIAHSIKELLKSDENKNAEYNVQSEEAIPDDKKESVFIFDEDFIRKEVRVESDGINTIVMLGEQVELDKQIDDLKTRLNLLETEYKRLDTQRLEYEDAKNNVSPKYYSNQIKEALREDNGWADIYRDLKGNVVKRVTDDILATLLDLQEPTEPLNVLHEKVVSDLALYKQTKDASTILWKKPSLGLPQNLDHLMTLLEQPLDSPILTEKEKRLVELLASHSTHSTEETKALLSEGWTFCPVCLREITEQDRNNIANTLTSILNKEANKYENLLQEELNKFTQIEIELPAFGGELNNDELKNANISIHNLNGILETICDTIRSRKNNIYQSIAVPFTDKFCASYKQGILDLDTALDALALCVTKFNNSVNEHKKLFVQIQDENNRLARKRLSPLLLNYRQAADKLKANSQSLQATTLEVEEVKKKIKQLISQKERTDIALDYINKELEYVFFSKRKIQLEAGDGCYKLKVNGKAVKPNKVSVGERNTLSLCYFFAKLFSGKSEATKYAAEYLIVIDDPISSFDYGNRIGVMSLLRFQFSNIVKGNPNSRILVMSHDLQSIFDLVKLRNEVNDKGQSSKNFMELKDRTLKVEKVQNEYKKLIESIFSYAYNESDNTLEMSIGNIMRRTLEAFSSFCYNDSFEKTLRNKELLESIPQSKRVYYENFMSRLILNSNSHMAESSYSLNNATGYFTHDEKVQTAKSLLLFLLYINKPHIVSYLSEDKAKIIENWENNETE